jgi:hypothetical protein
MLTPTDQVAPDATESKPKGRRQPPRIDARSEEQRSIAKHLREQHLPGVDTDDDASVALEIEQARLILFASGAALAFELTQLLSTSRAVCVGPLYYSIALLGLSMCGAWVALVLSEHLRRFRVDRRYKIYHGELGEYLNLAKNDVVNTYPTDAEWSGQIALETEKRSDLRVLRYFVAAFVAAGIGLGILAAIGTADPRRCHYELLKPQAAAPK